MGDGLLDSLIAARFVLGLVFLGAAAPKFIRFGDFRRALITYDLIPRTIIEPVAVMIPLLELALAAAFLGGWGSRLVPVAADGLLVLFAAAISINVIRERAIECGCGGWNRPTQVGWTLVARNLLLASLAAILVIEHPTSSVSLVDEHRVVASDLVALALTAALGLLAIAVIRGMIGLLRVSGDTTEALPRMGPS